MKILVCISKAPDTTSKIAFTDNNTKFDTNGVQFIINPYDEWYALVRGLELKEAAGGSVTVINVGGQDNDTIIRKALAIGADEAVRINTDPKDALFTAKQIANYAKDKDFDMVLCGKETINYNGSQVGGMIAELMTLPFISLATKLDMEDNTATIERDIEGGTEVVKVDTPFVVSASKGMAEARIPNMRGIMAARTKPLNVVEAADFSNATEVVSYELPPAKGDVKMIDADNPEGVIGTVEKRSKSYLIKEFQKMSVIVYANTANNEIHKAAFEAVSYGHQIAEKMGSSTTVVVIGEASDADSLGKFGADKILHAKASNLNDFNPAQYAKVLAKAVEQENAEVIILSHDFSGKAIAPLLSARLDAGIVTGAIDFPNTDNGFTVKKAVFSGKAFANIQINTAKKIISLLPNSIKKTEVNKSAEISDFQVELEDSRLKVVDVKMESTDMPLTEADRVVSAGRGLKGPENWGMIEELAKVLHAATACSRPVSDMDWRPHHEHVGQTGIAIRPNLYIAIGISGAIQHLAGVNQSKTIVVINTDPEAPFFKSADYGIVGDAFEVVPKLIEAAKNFNISSN